MNTQETIDHIKRCLDHGNSAFNANEVLVLLGEIDRLREHIAGEHKRMIDCQLKENELSQARTHHQQVPDESTKAVPSADVVYRDDAGGGDDASVRLGVGDNCQLKDRVKELEKIMRCNCDLDNWEPEGDTGHSWVCRIHRVAHGMNELL